MSKEIAVRDWSFPASEFRPAPSRAGHVNVFIPMLDVGL
jgi:hypothetical protein